MRRNGGSSKGLIWSIALLAIFVLGLFGYSISKEMRKNKQIEKEINLLKEEADKIEKENVALEEKISYLDSRDYQEVQAKDKLHLQNPDENVVVIAHGPAKLQESSGETEPQPIQKTAPTPNFEKWLNYFFN